MSFAKATQSKSRKPTKPGEVGLDVFDRARRNAKAEEEKKKKKSKMELFADKLYGGTN